MATKSKKSTAKSGAKSSNAKSGAKKSTTKKGTAKKQSTSSKTKTTRAKSSTANKSTRGASKSTKSQSKSTKAKGSKGKSGSGSSRKKSSAEKRLTRASFKGLTKSERRVAEKVTAQKKAEGFDNESAVALSLHAASKLENKNKSELAGAVSQVTKGVTSDKGIIKRMTSPSGKSALPAS